MKEKFLCEYEVMRVCNKSLACANRRNGKMVFIHRNAFNQLDQATDYRETEVEFNDTKQTWIQVLVWKTI